MHAARTNMCTCPRVTSLLSGSRHLQHIDIPSYMSRCWPSLAFLSSQRRLFFAPLKISIKAHRCQGQAKMEDMAGLQICQKAKVKPQKGLLVKLCPPRLPQPSREVLSVSTCFGCLGLWPCIDFAAFGENWGEGKPGQIARAYIATSAFSEFEGLSPRCYALGCGGFFSFWSPWNISSQKDVRMFRTHGFSPLPEAIPAGLFMQESPQKGKVITWKSMKSRL